MNSYTIYKEYYELITLLPEKEQQELLLAITKYMFEDEEPNNLSERQKKIFNNLKRPLSKSKEQSKRRTKQKPNENQKETKTKPKEQPKENTSNDVNVNVDVNVIKEIIEYLNSKTNSSYRYSSKTTQQKINARLNEGYTLNDFIAVIDKKSSEWIGTEFEKYLCPETLFGTKFEKYLNQKSKKKVPEWFDKKIDKVELNEDEMEEMKELLKEYKQ